MGHFGPGWASDEGADDGLRLDEPLDGCCRVDESSGVSVPACGLKTEQNGHCFVGEQRVG
jgi:hypothetical protein